MGLDLTLIPFNPRDREFAHATTLLDCNRHSMLFEVIMAGVTGQERAVPRYFGTLRSRADDGESHYGNTQETPYGEPLTWVPVRLLLPFGDGAAVQADWANRAVWAYLRELPPDWAIALYWH